MAAIRFGERESLCSLVFMAALMQIQGMNTAPGTGRDCQYRAAVYEHFSLPSYTPFITKSEAQVVMNINLDSYEEQVKRAAAKGSQIIVFPEYGVTGFFINASRKSIRPFLEIAPNTTEPLINPCTQEDFKDRPIQRRISCLAKQYSIILVVDMATMQPCEKTDVHCPSDGRYQFNSALAFGQDGSLLAIYHKTNLYTEELEIFDAGSKTGIADGVFQTDFGTFALFVCFDLLFDYPSREFHTFKVDTAVFPTGWMNELPLLTAVEYQQAWAMGMGMNLLAANQHVPAAQMTGSGLYSASGALKHYYNMDTLEGKLVVGDLPCFPSGTRQDRVFKNGSILSNSVLTSTQGYAHSLSNGNTTRSVHSNMDNRFEFPKKPNYGFSNLREKKENNETFVSLVNDDPFTLKLLIKGQDEVTVTDHGVTCTLSYTLADSWAEGDWYAFGAFSGLHTVNGQYYIQACVLLRCAEQHKSKCGAETSQANTKFYEFSIKINGYDAKATFLTPELLTNGVGLTKPKLTWDTNNVFDHIWSDGGRLKDPLLMAGIYGRLYAND